MPNRFVEDVRFDRLDEAAGESASERARRHT